MKKFLLLFILLTAFSSSYSQLPFYEFGFNVYENNLRIADTNFYKVTHKAFSRDKGKTVIFKQIKPSKDTSKTFGYDYLFVNGGARLKEYIIQIIIERLEDDIAQDVMWIEFDYHGAPLHSMLGLDKIVFTPGKFVFTDDTWPQNRRDRPMDYRYFPFIEEKFDWEKVRTE
ncbi:MAG: hypothetical protein JST55_17140 [Bacteroidetes bacterium]|nr:hypothetical protein [Bacteroidota bacterium]